VTLQQSNSYHKLNSDQPSYMPGTYGITRDNSAKALRSSITPTNLNAVFQNADQDTCRVVNVSNLAASYCGPFLGPNLDQSIYQLELESMLVKDKVEIMEQKLQDEKTKRQTIEQSHKVELEQARSQVQEMVKQLEKAAKDY